MESVKIKIKKLGAIKDAEIEIAPLMVFSGESGLGKSYLGMLVHYVYVLLTTERFEGLFKSKRYDLDELIKNKKEDGTLLRISTNELSEWINKDAITYLGYLLGHSDFEGEVNIKIPFKQDCFVFKVKEEILGLDNNEEVFYSFSLDDFPFPFRISTSSQKIQLIPLVSLLRAKLSSFVLGLFNKRAYLMPPSRGSLVELTARPPFKSGMYEEYFDNKEELERASPTNEGETSTVLLDCLVEINVGDIKREDGMLNYYTNGTKIPITAAASSIKELAPLTMFFKKCPAKGSSILFEEPEAHLHPDRQIKVADLVGCAVGLGSHMQITTHSDYFIKRINNLIQFYRLKEENNSQYKKLIDEFGIKEDCLINPDNVKAYVFTRNEDGNTVVKLQEIGEEGIPFESFYNVIDADLRLSVKLRKALEEGE